MRKNKDEKTKFVLRSAITVIFILCESLILSNGMETWTVSLFL